jgi:hypothetical protein
MPRALKPACHPKRAARRMVRAAGIEPAKPDPQTAYNQCTYEFLIGQLSQICAQISGKDCHDLVLLVTKWNQLIPSLKSAILDIAETVPQDPRLASIINRSAPPDRDCRSIGKVERSESGAERAIPCQSVDLYTVPGGREKPNQEAE